MYIDAYCVLGVDREYDLTAEALIRAMDRAGVERSLVVPVDRYLAVENQLGNRYVSEQSRLHPRRLIPACAASPWYGQSALDEFRRALADGARMLVLPPAAC